MVQNFTWILYRTVFWSIIFEVTDIFFFLCIYRNNRFSSIQELFRCFVDKPELGIPVRMLLADLIHFLVLLFAITKSFKRPWNNILTDIDAEFDKLSGNFTQAPCSPSERLFRASIGVSVLRYYFLYFFIQQRIFLKGSFSAGTRLPYTGCFRRLWILTFIHGSNLFHTGSNRITSGTSHLIHEWYASMAKRCGGTSI